MIKVTAAQKGEGKQKKKVPLPISIRSTRKGRKTSTDTFGIKMIVDQFGDGWYKCNMDFAVKSVPGEFCDRWHK